MTVDEFVSKAQRAMNEVAACKKALSEITPESDDRNAFVSTQSRRAQILERMYAAQTELSRLDDMLHVDTDAALVGALDEMEGKA